MDYKRLAAMGMSAALALSLGGGVLAKAPEKPSDATSGMSVSISRPSNSTQGCGTQEGASSRRSTDRAPDGGRQAPNAAGKQRDTKKPNEKPDQKPGQKPDAKTDGSRSTDKPEKKSDTSSAQNGKSSRTSTSYVAANTLSENASGTSYTSSADSENAVLVKGKNVALTDVTVSKTGSGSGDNADFYGINATVLATNGAELTISGAEITSNGAHANGVFSYGEGTVVRISGSTITTTGNTSGGLMTTGGGTMIADDLTVTTSGSSSAAIRSDRGGGTVTVNGGSYTSNGVGSPAIYSTADITVNGATLTSTASEGVVVEGKNSVTLNGVTLTDTNTTHAGKSSTDKNIFLYQSMSGDASVGTAQFTATDSTITTNRGDTIYVTNTTAEITLKNSTLVNNDGGALLRAEAARWGSEGKNGGKVNLTLDEQNVSGDVVADSISTVKMTLKNGSDYAGAVNGANTAKKADVTLEAGSIWRLTGDSYVSSLRGDTSGIDLNGHALYVDGVLWTK